MADELDESKRRPAGKAKAEPAAAVESEEPTTVTAAEPETAAAADLEVTTEPEVAAEPEAVKPARRSPARAAAEKRAAAGAEESEDPLDVATFDGNGERSGRFTLPASVFGQEPHMAAMHQAYVRQVSNGRQGTAKTKRRGEVSGGGAKPYRQKGTGRARHGSTREPSMVGGGTVFGPQPRSYAQRMPRKMRRLALRSALSVKAGERKISVLDGLDVSEPRTAVIADLLRAAGVEATGLLVLPAANDVVSRSAGNLPWAKVIVASNLNLHDIFTHDRLVIAKDAIGQIEETFGQ
ncbi:MAG: 50S ribosomal protein L4 [Candidatus Dormibacteraeota bacterium]|nr:50S ribosomal protein L4 [Candidatus Dormibacteraeota bacterium]